MKFRLVLLGFAGGCAATVLGASAFIHQPEPDPAAMERMWAEAMEKYCNPSKEHEALAKKAGTWDVQIQHWMMPDMPAEEMSGTASYQMIMDGRFLLGEYESEWAGEAFNGAGLEGFDRITGKYVTMWLDSMSTGLSLAYGTGSGKVIEYKGTMPDPMLGQHIEYRTVDRTIDNDTFKVEMYRNDPAGNEFKMMEITYRRAK